MTVSSRVWWGEGGREEGKESWGERAGDGVGGGGGDLKIRSKKTGGWGVGNMGGLKIRKKTGAWEKRRAYLLPKEHDCETFCFLQCFS